MLVPSDNRYHNGLLIELAEGFTVVGDYLLSFITVSDKIYLEVIQGRCIPPHIGATPDTPSSRSYFCG